jgi:hypothetical protein
MDAIRTVLSFWSKLVELPDPQAKLRLATVSIANSQRATDKRAETTAKFCGGSEEHGVLDRKLISRTVNTIIREVAFIANNQGDDGAATPRAFHANKHIRGIMELRATAVESKLVDEQSCMLSRLKVQSELSWVAYQSILTCIAPVDDGEASAADIRSVLWSDTPGQASAP